MSWRLGNGSKFQGKGKIAPPSHVKERKPAKRLQLAHHFLCSGVTTFRRSNDRQTWGHRGRALVRPRLRAQLREELVGADFQIPIIHEHRLVEFDEGPNLPLQSRRDWSACGLVLGERHGSLHSPLTNCIRRVNRDLDSWTVL